MTAPTTASSFPPRTRGWTLRARLAQYSLGVSPAHAGMDPGIWVKERYVDGFPRARGDGPHPHEYFRFAPAFPPRTRGWTPRLPMPSVSKDVSPAHAGMDPHSFYVLPFVCGFPRARGDGPMIYPVVASRMRFPPRTRGWTHGILAMNRTYTVSPAHAGMDPNGGVRTVIRDCFPRARGDGPRRRCEIEAITEFPPRTRGWTPHKANQDPDWTVSPAHAGMDPSSVPGSYSGSRFPRARGDGPDSHLRDTGGVKFPPRTRGWTRIGYVEYAITTVSPAHAGMDPLEKPIYSLSNRFPRARGDGPSLLRIITHD